MQKRICLYKSTFLGSKRFKSEAEKDVLIERSMDVFSFSCVLAELLEMDRHSFHMPNCSAIAEPSSHRTDEAMKSYIRELILHTIQLYPAKQFSAEE
jgi:hypothetical protein